MKKFWVIFLGVFMLFTMLTVTPATTLASTSSTINVNQLDSGTIKLLSDLTPSKEELIHATQNIGNNSVEVDLSNKKLVQEQLLKKDLTPQLRTILESIPVTIKVSAVDRKLIPVPVSMMIKNVSTNVVPNYATQYWQVSRSYTACSNNGYPMFMYTCSQSYGWDGTNVVYVSAPINSHVTYSPYGWTYTGVTNNVSTPIPYSFVHSVNQAYFSYSLLKYGWPWGNAFIRITFTYYGNGSFDSGVELGGSN